jgi:hypothetical protein
MTFEFVLQNYLKDAYRFSKLRNDRNARLGEVAELYDRLCCNWASVIPDACLNKMLDEKGAGFELNAINTVGIEQAGGGMIEIAVDGLVKLAETSKSEKEFYKVFM